MENEAIGSCEDVGAKIGLDFYNCGINVDKPEDVAVLEDVEDVHGTGAVAFTLDPTCIDGVIQEYKCMHRLLLSWCAIGVPRVLQNLTVTWCALMYDLEVDGKYEDPNKIQRS